jgi:hypothetical protein
MDFFVCYCDESRKLTLVTAHVVWFISHKYIVLFY